MLDRVLVALLVGALPAYMLWRSWAARGAAPERKVRRYARAMVIAAVLDGLLAVEWVRMGRSVRALGLGPPVTVAAIVGLGLAVCILGLVITITVARPRQTGSDETSVNELLPNTRAERLVFFVFSVVVGCSWEILYRGFLLWWLPPRLGLWGAIAVAAGAYGVAHGFKSAKSLTASLVSALIFTAAFAVTRSLWWLMLIHCGLPLIGALAFLRRQASETLPTGSGAR